MQIVWILFFCYLGFMNLLAAILTWADKHRAKKGKWRISEARLLWVGISGGALLEWITMKLIRHKTTRSKFMVGLPVIFFLQAILIGILLWLSFHYGLL